MQLMRTAAALSAALFAACALAAGNTTNEDFRESKKMLERKVYFDHRVTLYCGYAYDKEKNVSLPEGFTTKLHRERAGRVEWEHVVPAENFGRYFKERREGSGRCINEKGHSYNLFPAVGAVNAVRSNYNYEMLPDAPYAFGTCEMKIENRKAEPPERSRGEIARAMLYMEQTYAPVYRMSARQRRMVEEWNAKYPVTQWECTRAGRIAGLQGNESEVTADACRRAGLEYAVIRPAEEKRRKK